MLLLQRAHFRVAVAFGIVNDKNLESWLFHRTNQLDRDFNRGSIHGSHSGGAQSSIQQDAA
jgi:hypothetical protein